MNVDEILRIPKSVRELLTRDTRTVIRETPYLSVEELRAAIDLELARERPRLGVLNRLHARYSKLRRQAEWLRILSNLSGEAIVAWRD